VHGDPWTTEKHTQYIHVLSHTHTHTHIYIYIYIYIYIHATSEWSEMNMNAITHIIMLYFTYRPTPIARKTQKKQAHYMIIE